MLFVVDNDKAVIPPTGRKAAIVSVIIGDLYIATWQRLCSASWQQYAERHGFDIIIIKSHLDKSSRSLSRSPAWQKLLILSLPWSQQYERIVWLDSDIIIAHDAPNIVKYAGPVEKIAITLNGGRSSDAEKMIFFERLYKVRVSPDFESQIWATEQEKSYESHASQKHEYMFNTGVMVLSPLHHRALFLQAYEGKESGRLYEQPQLSHEIIVRNLAHLITNRFNWGIQETLFLYLPESVGSRNLPPDKNEDFIKLLRFFVRRELANAYFLHFYGTMNLMSRMSFDDVYGGDAFGNL